MRFRTVALACLFLVAIVAAAYAAAPTATVDDVTANTITLGSLKCDTNYNIRLRTRRADGTFSATQTLNQRTDACAPPPPPPPAACADGIDNDSDGLIDYPADPGCSSASDTDETDPVVGGGGTEPAPIAGQGYHEAFRDDFNVLDRTVWDDHIWYDDPPCQGVVTDSCPSGANWAGFQEADSSGVLHLRTSRNFLYSGCLSNCYPINTITTQSSGKTFQYGYFETRMKWPAGYGSWPGFWLYSYQHAIDQNQCTTQAGEVDVMEGQGSEPKVFYGTVHLNTNGCNPPDDQNGNNYQPQNIDLTAGFHTYAVKWTPSTVTWYLDGQATHSAATYATDNQPMFLLLQEWSGGWTYDPDATTPDTLDNQIDYVDVWQQ